MSGLDPSFVNIMVLNWEGKEESIGILINVEERIAGVAWAIETSKEAIVVTCVVIDWEITTKGSTLGYYYCW